MITDALLALSDAQAVTTSAASTNIVDLGVDRNIGIGEPLCVFINVDVALAGTSPTLIIAVQTYSTSAFTTPVALFTSQTYSSLAINTKIVCPIPPDLLGDRWLRCYYTTGGTSPTVTLTASIQPQNMIQAEVAYAKNYPIT